MNQVEKSVNFFKALGDLSRIKIVLALKDGEKTVNAIAIEIGMSQSAVSHQLQVLKLCDVVISNKRGREVYYSLADEHVNNIVEQIMEHSRHIGAGK